MIKSLFNKEKCDFCGLCFQNCPVLKLPIEDSKKEIKRLVNGQESKYVLKKCHTCFSCNLYCPKEANPYQLILKRWTELSKKRGAPPLYRFVCPTEEPNIWQLLNLFLSNQERRWIFKWMNYKPKPDDSILLIGSYTHLFPFILGGSKLLEYFKPIDLLDQWEAGAYLYQGGYLDIVKKIAQNCRDDFDAWGIKNVATPLDTIEYMFTEVHPNQMGVKYTQNFINFNQFLLEKIDSGAIKLSSLDLDVTVHDNCFSKSKEGEFWDRPREILKKCGCNIIEMEHIRKDSLCCGFGAGASWVKNMSIPFDILSQGAVKFSEAEATGAKALVSYCTGCHYLLWATRELLGSKIEIYHILEVIRMAMGEKLPYPEAHIKRAWDVIAIITYQLTVSMFQKNFFIKKITYDKSKTTFQPKKYLILRLIRFLFRIKLIRKVYAKIFRFLMPRMKTQ
jgi:Fe-S oxidoreductase